MRGAAGRALAAGRMSLVAGFLLACAWRPAGAHVGSPDTWFEGTAGPYPVRVVVRAPGVVPGLAEINVRVLEGEARQVAIRPFIWNAGPSGAPPPDIARPVPGDPRLHAVQLWFMRAGSYAVHVTVRGDRGEGTAIVPVQAVATRRLPMDRALAVTLIALGLFLSVGLLTVVGAAVGESVVPPGEEPDRAHRRRARIAVVAAAAFLALGLVGGRRWWNGEDRAYQMQLFRPVHATATVMEQGNARVLQLAIDDPNWINRNWTPLIPDHGKLMHLFLVRLPAHDAFAHLHPVMRDSSHFEATLPPIPAGRYRVYADIVHENGLAETLVASADLPVAGSGGGGAAVASTEEPGGDPDDSWSAAAPAQAASSAEARFTLRDGSTLVWQRGPEPLVEGRDRPLRFEVRARDGRPALLEPYLGMPAHAVVTREDGAVFAHLHPVGTISMASQMALMMRTPADTLPGSLGRRLSAMHEMAEPARVADPPGTFSIPYGFPSPGRYRLWVQIKLRGEVQTAVFDVAVAAGRA